MLKTVNQVPGLKTLLDETEKKIEALVGYAVSVYYNIRIIDVTTTELIAIVCNVCCVDIPDVLSPRRYHELVRARQLFSWFAHKHLGLTITKIGILLGFRDHSTIIKQLKVVQDMIDINDTETEKLISDVKAAINEVTLKKRNEKVQVNTNA